ncbi:hypothetical protein MPL1032_270039 [Mesorhizobium plurifarium]|uniref:Uncharacterized protein n=1 Tax=Mesorhizobium plurifarium TaxID=69974 RepID=A0A0K2W2I8_MESPL|nr:hypothetical protein MPL1032_270039 [Mesorhizobium plurifarium]
MMPKGVERFSDDIMPCRWNRGAPTSGPAQATISRQGLARSAGDGFHRNLGFTMLRKNTFS